MTIQICDVLREFNYRITGGQEFGWKCFGENAWIVDVGYDTSVYFDRMTGEVYAINCYTFDECNFHWINPAYFAAYKEECEKRGVGEDEKYVDYETILSVVHDSDFEGQIYSGEK